MYRAYIVTNNDTTTSIQVTTKEWELAAEFLANGTAFLYVGKYTTQFAAFNAALDFMLTTANTVTA